MLTFIVSLVTIHCDKHWDLGRRVTSEHMDALVRMGYAMRLLDEATGWDFTTPFEPVEAS